MELSVKNALYESIMNNKWLDIIYVNKASETTYYYIGIKDIDVEKDLILCDIFNAYKKDKKDLNNVSIKISGIKKAKILDASFYDTPLTLVNKINNDKNIINYLDVINYDNNILRYLSDCYKADSDPYLKHSVTIDGVDNHTLIEKSKYKLDEKQFEDILNKVFKKPLYDAEVMNRYQQLAINKFSIDINDKQYVVAYKELFINFKDKTLRVSKKTFFNKSFLVDEDKKMTLSMYIDMNQDEFCASYDEHEREYIELIQSNFKRGEKVNTRPSIFFLERNVTYGVDMACESIYALDSENKLTLPLKAFFGRNRPSKGSSKEVNIVVFDKTKINIDQIRVIYSAMLNHVTYVKGPPGTGKTETIFNVILSAYSNNKTVLICSNNNHPVNDIYSKMQKFMVKTNYRTKKEEDILFPIIRLGNNLEVVESMNTIRSVVDFISSKNLKSLKDEITETSKRRSMDGFNKLKQLLIEYEERVDNEDKLSTLLKIKNITKIDALNQKLDEQIKVYENKIKNGREISDEDVLEYALSASKDTNFQNFIYYSSLARYKKLLSPSYKDLIEILNIEDTIEALNQFNKYLKNNDNLKKFLSVFPFVVSTNISCDKLGSPSPHFDLVIMDEAGQCNIASSLIPIVRGNDLLLVGDTNQLQPVTVIEESTNERLMDKYGVKSEYDYIRNSILSSMMRVDNNSKNILLRYHYRCGRKIANFSNKRYYNSQLKLLNKHEGKLTYVNVKNIYNKNSRNAYEQEARAIVEIIKNNNYKDVGVITPFVNQAALINEYLIKEGITDVKAGTIHTLQGSEKNTIIMSSALSLRTSKNTLKWIENNYELINVAVTRAKEQFIFVGDKQAIDLLSGNNKSDIKVLSDYVYAKGEIFVPESELKIVNDFSNNSKNEKEFFDTIGPYFNRRGTKFKIDANVPLNQALNALSAQDKDIFGKKEFDIVVSVGEGLIRKKYRTLVVFEIDGGEHIGLKRQSRLDREKEMICQKYGIKLIRIPNSAVKDYEMIISLFEYVVSGLPSIDKAYSRLSLFEDND